MRLWDYWKHAQHSLESFSPPILQIAMQGFCRVWRAGCRGKTGETKKKNSSKYHYGFAGAKKMLFFIHSSRAVNQKYLSNVFHQQG